MNEYIVEVRITRIGDKFNGEFYEFDAFTVGANEISLPVSLETINTRIEDILVKDFDCYHLDRDEQDGIVICNECGLDVTNEIAVRYQDAF